MSRLDKIGMSESAEYYQAQQEQIDNAIAEFLKAMQGVDREELLNALTYIEQVSNSCCVVKVPGDL